MRKSTEMKANRKRRESAEMRTKRSHRARKTSAEQAQTVHDSAGMEQNVRSGLRKASVHTCEESANREQRSEIAEVLELR